MVPESTIEPLDMPALADVDVPDDAASARRSRAPP